MSCGLEPLSLGRIINFARVAAIATLSSPLLAAANLKAPSAILSQYCDQRITWFTAIWPYANTLFGMLAVIEFAWSAAIMLLKKTDLQSWTAALVRKVMWLGAFYALLLYGRFWIPAITDSFEIIGQNAAGTGPMSPSDVFSRGIDLAGALMATSSSAAFFTNLGTSLTMVVTGIITALPFIAITVQLVVAMVESYIIVAAAFIFVGFGGSRWTYDKAPDQLGPDRIREYSAYLFRERKLDPGTIQQHVAGLRFFYVKTLKRHFLLEDLPMPKRSPPHSGDPQPTQ